MISSIENLIDNLDKKEQVISYLKTIYKEKTGEEPVIPEISEQNQLIPTESDEQSETVPNQRFQSFKDKVNSLNLPSVNDKDAKNRIEKLRRKKDTSVLIQKLDLSHFANKEITHELMRKVIEGLKILKSVQILILSHNDLNDSYIDLIIDFLLLPGLSQIDLSYNKLTPACIKKLNNTIKAAKNLQYFDVSYNPFNNDEFSCLTLCSSMKNCEKLFHFGICDSSRDSGLCVLSMRPSLISLNLEDSRYKKNTWDFFTRYLSNKKYELSILSLKYCYIDFVYGATFLSRGLAKNRTLLRLNLYSTGLGDVSGKLIIESLINHRLLQELDLGANKLSTNSCIAIGKMLKVNKVIKEINITRNYNIVNENFTYIIEGLVENNTLLSLGDLIDTKIGVKFRECTEKLLSNNKNFGDWREADKLKNQKVDIYMSNILTEVAQKQKEDIPVKNVNESLKLNSSMNSLKTSANLNKDINSIIAPLSPNKKNFNVFISNDQMDTINSNYNSINSMQQQKIVVPFSLPNTNYLGQSKQVADNIAPQKKKQVAANIAPQKKKSPSPRKRTTSSSPGRKSNSKGKQPVQTIPKHSILNTIASYTQEILNKNPELYIPQEQKKQGDILQTSQRKIQFKNNIPYSEKASGPNVPDDANLTNLDKQSCDDILSKYGIGRKSGIPNSYEEQAIFGSYLN